MRDGSFAGRLGASADHQDAVAGFSFLTHFQSISKGVLDLRDMIFFLMVIGFWLFANAVVIDLKKAD